MGNLEHNKDTEKQVFTPYNPFNITNSNTSLVKPTEQDIPQGSPKKEPRVCDQILKHSYNVNPSDL